MSMHSYRGFEIHPLIHPHSKTTDTFSHNHEHGFGASVKIFCVDRS